jgi:hypothetical protein
MSANVRDQLRNQDLGTVDPASFSVVGSRVFPDRHAISDSQALVAIVDSWRATHAVAFGGPIGGTDAVETHAMQTDAVEAVYTPQNRQVARIVAVQVANGGGAPMTAEIYVGGVLLGVQQITINPSESSGFLLQSPVFVGADTPLQVKISSGTVSDATVKVAYILCGV